MQKTNIIFDTDIGCDCDDAGALAVLHHYSDLGRVNILAVTFCTSSPYGAGSIDSINRYYNRPDIPVGTLKEKGFMDEERFYNYGPELCSSYDNAYPKGDLAEDSVRVFRRALSEACGMVKIAATGPMHNLPLFLRSQADDISDLSGEQLIREKVSELVVMGGYFPEGGKVVFADGNEMGPEFNIVCDIAAAKYVSENWPTPIVCTGFEIGYRILTGQRLLDMFDNFNPVRRSYELYCNSARHSWDQTAIVYAAEGMSDLWDLSDPGHIMIDDSGNTSIRYGSGKNHRFLIEKKDAGAISEYIDLMMCHKPVN